MTETEPRTLAETPTLVTHCLRCEDPVGSDRHIKEVNGRYYALCYGCSDADPPDPTEQTTFGEVGQ